MRAVDLAKSHLISRSPTQTAGDTGAASTEAGAALPPKILNITAPQVGHFPFTAFRPFFMVSSTPSTMGFFALHLTQYPSAMAIPFRFGWSAGFTQTRTGR